MRPGIRDQVRLDIAKELDRKSRERRERSAVAGLRLAERLAGDRKRLTARLDEIRIDKRFD